MQAGELEDGLETVWRESVVLSSVREASLVDAGTEEQHPLSLLLGGGDIDHSFHAGGTLTGNDPYMRLYSEIALMLIAEHAQRFPSGNRIGLRCRMGECLVECGPGSAPLMFTHSNCVQSVADGDNHTVVRSFYSEAAETVKEDILNPVSYGDDRLAHIPETMRLRSYGCGSPVLDVDLQPGQNLVDLGSGTGIECFIASEATDPEGKIFGINMSDAMLQRARETAEHVAGNLGYANVAFRKGLLEELPLDDNCADYIISNCVINLTSDKRRVFCEIFRVLKPGGSLCISDIVTAGDLPVDMKYNERLRDECLGGAMLQQELFALLDETGFTGSYLVRRYEYKRIQSTPFYSITYRAYKPEPLRKQRIIYRGPLEEASIGGVTAIRGVVVEASVETARLDPDSFFILDDIGVMTDI